MGKIIVAIDIPEMDAESLRVDLEDAKDDWFPAGDNMISIDKEYIPDDILNRWFVSLEFIGVTDYIAKVEIKE